MADIADLFATRQRWYIKFMATFHRYIARVLRCDKALRDKKATECDADGVKVISTKIRIAPKLGYPTIENTRHFQLCGESSNMDSTFQCLEPETRDLCRFLVSLSIKPVQAHIGGVTWEELYLLYRIHCGQDQ